MVTPQMLAGLQERITFYEEQLARLEQGTDPDLPENPTIRAALAKSYPACLRLYRNTYNHYLAQLSSEDLA